MIRDQRFKRIFIPLTGALFPFLTGMVHSHSDGWLLMVLAALFFTGVVFVMWTGVVRFAIALRTLAGVKRHIPTKLLALTLIAGIYTAAIGFIMSAFWLSIGNEPFRYGPVVRATITAGVGGILLSLMYEVVFLSVEKELDTRVLQQIDRERQEAEVNVLKNELDPHFFFNCMNTLSYLVREDKDKAHQFVHKLSSIYKYFLRNKDMHYVPLSDELEFLENYYFLLRIRFDDNIRIENTIDPRNGTICILPCTLQVLVENAIKHNHFSEQEPLVVSIGMNSFFISVSNPFRPRLHAAESTKIGLRNLKARYRLITNQNVLVQKTAGRFIVKLPIVKQTNRYDKSSDH